MAEIAHNINNTRTATEFADSSLAEIEKEIYNEGVCELEGFVFYE